MESKKEKPLGQSNDQLGGAKEKVKENATTLWKSVKEFLVSLISVKNEVDYINTPSRIEQNVKFEGFNVWVLICSIVIASVGLNANSTAVIIGAMLISPLMGPIVGIGFALGTYRFPLLKRSFLNYLIMVFVGLFASWLYFLLTPLDKADTEILARTSPTILDVMVAVFGGLAGAIAGSQKSKNITVVPGVAIATALMPPLCTVGYGIATWQVDFALGAIYLFLLNTIIISLSTTIYVRVVGFQQHAFIDKKKEKRAKLLIAAFLFLLIVPSVMFFMNATKKSSYEANAESFIEKEIKHQNTYVISRQITYSANQKSKIEVLLGGQTVHDTVVANWEARLEEYSIQNSSLIIIQDIGDEMLAEKIKELENKSLREEEIKKTSLNVMLLENQLELKQKDSILTAIGRGVAIKDSFYLEFPKISSEINTLYSGVEKTALGRIVEETEDGSIDTIPTVFIKWKNNVSQMNQVNRVKRIKDWLNIRTNNPKLDVRRY